MKPFLPRQAISHLRKCRFSSHPSFYTNAPSIQTPFFSSSSSHLILPIPNLPTSISFCSSLHSLQPNNLIKADDNDEDDTSMNEFLSRFVWIIRGKLSETYPDCNKETIDGMLLIIVQKVVSEMERGGLDEMLDSATRTQSLDFSQDLWKTVWEVCNSVLDDMRKAHKKEEMKKFLQAEEVKDMCHFAGDVGIRGDMLRELRFKWAREKMEESEFYQSLERLRKEAHQGENVESEDAAQVINDDSSVTTEENSKAVALPQRRGKIKYKIYGLDLSSPKWAEVADRIHEAEKLITPEEPKLISGQCKMVTERILTLTEEDDPFPLLAEWVELLQPSRIDWLVLLDKMKEHNIVLYFKLGDKSSGSHPTNDHGNKISVPRNRSRRWTTTKS